MPEDESIRIKDYQIHFPPLGEGAYGRVFRATYRGISDRAIKVFRSGAVDLSTMARELEKLSRVAEHHGIVTLHDFDLLSDPPYYAMGLHADELGNGEFETRTLERLCGTVDHREGWRLLREIADALAYLHRNQIIHCDVKPSNVLLTDETPFGIKICDFGQSRGDALEGFNPAGTPLYASPEQLRNPRDSADGKGFRWDVYSFGVVAYKLITGRLPRLQTFADSERKSYDPEATIAESSMEATVAEGAGGNDRLAALTESEPNITWPSDVSIPSDRRELIERCLQLDPEKRFADMREVWIAMQQIDQQRVVRRARRLNALFAGLLIIAIWATGFAFFQAKRAHDASENVIKSREQAEELVFFVLTKLNREDLSGPGLEELYDHIADNAETYLENLPKSRRSESLLRISANTASIRARQALEQGALDLALEKFRNAHEIRAQLAEDSGNPPELSWRASNDLFQIGLILEQQEKYDEALEVFTEALGERIGNANLDGPLEMARLRRITEALNAIARVHRENDSPEEAIETYNRAIELHGITAEDAEPEVATLVGLELMKLLESLGAVQFSAGEFADATRSYEQLLSVADSIRNATGGYHPEAAVAYADGLNAIGRIQLAQEETAAAATYFRQEIPIRERLSEEQPYDPTVRISLAEAYASLAACLDLEDGADRSLALFHLQQAASLIRDLPPQQKDDPAIQEKLTRYGEKVSEILEMEE